MKIILHPSRLRRRRPRGRQLLTTAIVCVLAAFVSGCVAAPSAAVGDAPATRSSASAALTNPAAAADFHILAGEMAIQRGMAATAAQHYVAALDYTDDEALARRATRIALFAGKLELAYRAAGEWARLAPTALDAQKTAARLALVAGDAAGLTRYSEGVVDTAESPLKAYQLLTDILSSRAEQGTIAVQALTTLAQRHQDSRAAWYALGLVALRFDNVDVAANAAQQAMAVAPDWDQAVLLRAATAIRQQQPERAQTLIAGLPGSAEQRSGYHLSLAQLLARARQPDAALAEFEQALALQSDNSAARYGVALLALDRGHFDRAEAAFKRLYENNKHPERSAYFLGRIHEQREQFADAETWYRRVTEGDHLVDASVRAALMEARQGRLAVARGQLQQLREGHPKMAGRLYGAEARMLFTAGQYQDALAIYDEALQQTPDDIDLLYGRSIVNGRLGRVDPALADLRHILKLEPGAPRAMNALGYVLTNHTERYQEALKLITQALQADPDNPAILDSMGWVQYHLGNLDAALDDLQRAYKAFPDPEVAAHLGEVLWVLGKHEQAQRVWQESLSANPDHELLQQTIDRLTSP